MTRAQALAVAWTGIEALVRARSAKLYRHRDGSIYIRLTGARYDAASGLVEAE